MRCAVRCAAVRPGTDSCVRSARRRRWGRGVRCGWRTRIRRYPGKAWLYRDHPDYGGEVDHGALMGRLAAPMTGGRCQPRRRRCLPSWSPGRGGPIRCVRGGAAGYAAGPGDWGQARRGVPVDYHPARHGARDRPDDLFPGSGAVGRAWAAYTGCQPSRPAASDASCPDPGDVSSPAAGNGLDPSSSPASDASCKARVDASVPAVADGSDASCGAWDDGCLFPLEAAR